MVQDHGTLNDLRDQGLVMVRDPEMMNGCPGKHHEMVLDLEILIRLGGDNVNFE